MENGDWPCCSIDYQVSLTGPQPWDVVCKNKHHPECVVLPTTLGNVPVMPRYYCRGRSHDNATIFGWYGGEFKKGTVSSHASWWLFGIVFARIFIYIWACMFIYYYIILYVCFCFSFIYICVVSSDYTGITVVVVVVVVLCCLCCHVYPISIPVTRCCMS